MPSASPPQLLMLRREGRCPCHWLASVYSLALILTVPNSHSRWWRLCPVLPKQSRQRWAEFANWCNAYALTKSHVLKKSLSWYINTQGVCLAWRFTWHITFPLCSVHWFSLEGKSPPQAPYSCFQPSTEIALEIRQLFPSKMLLF